MAQTLRIAAFALLAPAFGLAYYGSTFVDQPAPVQAGNVEPAIIAPAPEEATQQPVQSSKVDRDVVTAALPLEAEVKPPVREANEIPPPVFGDVMDREEAKPLSAPPVAEAVKEEPVKEPARAVKPQVADVEAEKPAVEPAAKAKPRAAHAAKKKAAKPNVAKRAVREKTRLSVPLVLVPPQKVAEPVEQGSGDVKPVSEAPGKVRQNFGPATTDDQFRRK